MNFIQEKAKGIRFYTGMKDVEQWLQIKLKDFDWHISDIDGGWKEIKDPCWVKGEVLEEKLSEYDYQFVWAVFSAFPKNTMPFLSEIPYADGNEELWKVTPEKQLKMALFEIVCWGSSATLFIGLSELLSQNLQKNASGIKDLNKYNEKYC